MKYKYSKLAIYSQYAGILLFDLLAIGLVFFLEPNDRKFQIKMIVGILGIAFFMIGLYDKEFRQRYVELTDEYVRFNSFRFKDVRMKKAIAFSVKYEDIISVNVRTLPIIGIWAISIKAKNLPQRVTVSFCFKKHKEFYDYLCKHVENKNSNAYIDKRLKEYIEREKHE